MADGTDVEILNVIDDHSRLLVASRAFVTARSFLFWLALAVAVYVAGRAVVALARGLAPPWPAEARSIPLYLLFSFLRLSAAYVLALAWTVWRLWRLRS